MLLQLSRAKPGNPASNLYSLMLQYVVYKLAKFYCDAIYYSRKWTYVIDLFMVRLVL